MTNIGLAEAQVNRSRNEHGKNEISVGKQTGFFGMFATNFNDPIIRILLFALGANLLLTFRGADWRESIGIAAAIFISALVSTISEYGSELAYRRLSEQSSSVRCRVIRNAHTVLIPATDIVVGDTVMISAGDRISADGVIISGRLSVDQSPLNGESNESQKYPCRSIRRDLNSPVCLFTGSLVSDGEALMRVTAVGDNTFWGQMACQMQQKSRTSPLKERLSHLAGTLGKIGYIAAAAVVAADLISLFLLSPSPAPLTVPLIVSHLLHALTLGITVVVVAVPEGLPMMITVVLSSNMLKMKRDNVMIRKLVGIETAGSMNMLFFDKTGTLTRGKPKMTSFISAEINHYSSLSSVPADIRPTVLLSLAANNSSSYASGKPIGSNTTDRALLAFAGERNASSLKYEKLSVLPFNSTNKYSATEIKVRGESFILIKGAPEKLLPKCSKMLLDSGETTAFSNRGGAEAALRELTERACRVLALAVSQNGSFDNLVFIGFASIRDDLRPQAKAALCNIERAGIRCIMITGDAPETAAAIARESSLIHGGGDEHIITSSELHDMTDDELSRRLPSIRVIARALPTDKTRLVRIAQQAGLVCGMTGDGINDSPALKLADVGFAMGSGTDVAREAGDIIITDDNISSIEKAVLYGRTIFKSIRKFIVFQLTMNLSAVGVSVICPFLGIDTPVTVIQMLWINLIMDTLAGLAFAGEAPLMRYMREKPKKRDEPVLSSHMIKRILCMGFYTVALCIAFLYTNLFDAFFRSDSTVKFSAFFALFVFCGIFNCFNARTDRLNLIAGLWHNKPFTVIIASVICTQICMIYFGGELFRCVPLTSFELRTLILLAMTVIPVDMIRKTASRLKS